MRWAVWWEVEGGANGEDCCTGEATVRGVDGRVDSEGETANVSRLRAS